MCVIIYKPKKIKLTRKTLKDCWTENPNGAGFMYAADNKLHVQKGYMSFKSFYKAFRRCEERHFEDFVIHFRIATHGDIKPNNCHPFAVNNNLAFTHNGILRCVEPTGQDSDTLVFCRQVLQKMPVGFINRPEYRLLLESVAVAESSKFVFLTNKGKVFIFNEKAGVWNRGAWYSNMFHNENEYKFLSWNTETYCGSSLSERDYKGNWVECSWCGDYIPENEALITYHDILCNVCAAEIEKVYGGGG